MSTLDYGTIHNIRGYLQSVSVNYRYRYLLISKIRSLIDLDIDLISIRYLWTSNRY
jgi:hypothetical protein